MKFNYIICGDGQYYQYGYHDIINLPEVSYHSTYADGFNTFFSNKILRLNFSRVVNRYIKTPFSWFVYPRLFPHSFPDQTKPICFIFFGNREYVFQTSYLDYIRKHYKKSVIVLYLQDIVTSNPWLDINKWKNKFDLILSYDEGDCKKYGFEFYPTPMSCVNVPDDDRIEDSDIYFCGKAKSRYPLVHDIFKKCTNLGLKCDFHLMEFPESEKKIQGIHYDNKYLTYEENLQHIQKTRCILEVMQEGADGFTPRLWESIVYDKHLVTSNNAVMVSKYYNACGMSSLDIINQREFSEWIEKDCHYDKLLKDSLSPIKLLDYIESFF